LTNNLALRLQLTGNRDRVPGDRTFKIREPFPNEPRKLCEPDWFGSQDRKYGLRDLFVLVGGNGQGLLPADTIDDHSFLSFRSCRHTVSSDLVRMSLDSFSPTTKLNEASASVERTARSRIPATLERTAERPFAAPPWLCHEIVISNFP
jgi:hypothetical protein